MKNHFLIILLAIGLSSHAQDTTKHLSKSSISFTAGVNIIYPTLSSIREVEDIGGFNYRFYSNYIITPSASVKPWFAFSYSYLVTSKKHFCFGVKLGLGFTQYKYGGTAQGYDYEYDLGPYRRDSGDFAGERVVDKLEISEGAFLKLQVLKKIGWYNEINFLESGEVYSNFKGDDTSAIFKSTEAYNKLYRPMNSGNQNYYSQNYGVICLFYETGITIQVSNAFTIMPMITFPLIDISALGSQWNMFFKELTPFNTLRTGVTLTYRFNKKA